MNDLDEILQKPTIDDMIPLIIIYSGRHFNIEVGKTTIGSYHDDAEKNEGYFYYHRKMRKALDVGQLMDLQTSYFKSILEAVGLEKLIEIKNRIATLLSSKELEHDYFSENPDVYVAFQYLQSLHFSVSQQLKETIYNTLSHFLQSSDEALEFNINTAIIALENNMSQFDLESLMDFNDLLMNVMLNIVDESYAEELNRVSTLITAVIQKKLAFFPRYGALENLPSLKLRAQIQKYLPQMPRETRQHLDNFFFTVHILEILIKYEQEVKSSITDLQKTQKLLLIKQLKELCHTTTHLDEIYQTIQSNEKILKTSSIGRRLYEYICAVFNFKTNSTVYPTKLFEAIPRTLSEPETQENHSAHHLKNSRNKK